MALALLRAWHRSQPPFCAHISLETKNGVNSHCTLQRRWTLSYIATRPSFEPAAVPPPRRYLHFHLHRPRSADFATSAAISPYNRSTQPSTSSAMTSIAAQIASLAARITALEKQSPPPKPLSPPPATDAFASHQSVALLAASQTDFRLARAPPPYYTWPLDERRAFLCAPSTRHLCKSIVMRNTAWNAAAGGARLNAQYYCCIVSYTTKLSSAGLTRILRQACLDAGTAPPPKKEMHFRLADGIYSLVFTRPCGFENPL